MDNKPWELTEIEIDNLTKDCYGQNITQGKQLAREAQIKLMRYLKDGAVFEGTCPIGYWISEDRWDNICEHLEVKT